MSLADVFVETLPLLSQGLWMTAKATVLSLLIAMVLGLISCLFGISKIKPLKWLSSLYIWIIRGTPLMVQALFIYFALPQLLQSLGMTNFRISAFAASVAALSLNAGAYMSEIFRGGIQAVDKGQMEAARSLGLPKRNAMVRVVLPQAFKICIPSLVNQCIITLKDTSIVSVIGLTEIVYQARIYTGATMRVLATWTIVAGYYLLITSILMLLSKYIERRLSRGKGKSN